MSRQTVNVNGKRFVMVPVDEFERLERLAGEPEADGDSMPEYPRPDAQGNFPALEYIQTSIAREIIKERKALGLTQAVLAKLAGVRQETLSRLESGKHSPTVRTVEKIDRALQRAAAKRKPSRTLPPKKAVR